MQGVQSLLRMLRLLVAIDWRAIVVALACLCDSCMCGSSLLGNFDVSESLESMRISTRLYSLLLSSLILSTSFAALKTLVLLMCLSHRCQSQTRLFWLTRYVGRPRLVMVIAKCLGHHFVGVMAFDFGPIIAMAFLRYVSQA